jgi:hypothetical protein
MHKCAKRVQYYRVLHIGFSATCGTVRESNGVLCASVRSASVPSVAYCRLESCASVELPYATSLARALGAHERVVRCGPDPVE